MQVLFLMGLLGLIFASMTFINASLTITAMEKKLSQIENVKTLMDDVKTAVTDGVFSVEADLRALETVGELSNLKFVSSYVKWNNEELLADPWGKPYRVMSASKMQTIYASTRPSPPNNAIRAYVTAFAIVSAGPDGAFGQDAGAASWPTSYNDIRSYTPEHASAGEVGEDDLFITFTTYSSALALWSRVFSVVEKAKILSVNDYAEKVAKFSPKIKNFYENKGVTLLVDHNGDYILDDAAWMSDPDLLMESDFPQMVTHISSLGLKDEIENLPPVFDISLQTVDTDGDGFIDRDKIDIIIEPVITGREHNWSLTYRDTVSGSNIGVN